LIIDSSWGERSGEWTVYQILEINARLQSVGIYFKKAITVTGN